MSNQAKIFNIAKTVQKFADEHFLPSSEIKIENKNTVLPYVLFKNTRGYIEKLVFQINKSYENTCYDACAVMVRRLIELLIIETFEYHSIAQKIKNTNGDFFMLSDLINLTLSEHTWTLGRNTKNGLKKLKIVGDLSAHCRRYNAKRDDIDKIRHDLRVVAEELLYLSSLLK